MKNFLPVILITLVLLLPEAETQKPDPAPEPEPEVAVQPLVAPKPELHKPKPYVEPIAVRKEYKLWMFTLPGCVPCEMYKSAFKDMDWTADYEGKSKVWLIDGSTFPESAKGWGVQAYPTFMIVEEGAEKPFRVREMGARHIAEAKMMLREYFPEMFGEEP